MTLGCKGVFSLSIQFFYMAGLAAETQTRPRSSGGYPFFPAEVRADSIASDAEFDCQSPRLDDCQ